MKVKVFEQKKQFSDRAYLVYVGEIATVGQHGTVVSVGAVNVVVDDGQEGNVQVFNHFYVVYFDQQKMYACARALMVGFVLIY